MESWVLNDVAEVGQGVVDDKLSGLKTTVEDARGRSGGQWQIRPLQSGTRRETRDKRAIVAPRRISRMLA